MYSVIFGETPFVAGAGAAPLVVLLAMLGCWTKEKVGRLRDGLRSRWRRDGSMEDQLLCFGTELGKRERLGKVQLVPANDRVRWPMGWLGTAHCGSTSINGTWNRLNRMGHTKVIEPS